MFLHPSYRYSLKHFVLPESRRAGELARAGSKNDVIEPKAGLDWTKPKTEENYSF